MNAPTREKSRVVIYAASAGLIIAILLLAGVMSIAGAQSEPQKAPFTGVLVAADPDQASSSMAPVDLGALGPEWRPIFQENFEGANWEVKWDVNLDKSSAGYKWGTRSVPNSLDPTSTAVAWAIGAGTNGSGIDPIAPSYPKGVDSWLVAGPFDLSGADDALVNLELFYEANGGDPFTVSLSENRIQFTPQLTVNENVKPGKGEWEQKTVPLASFVGKPQIWIAFTFSSGNSAQKLGALMDNISVWVEGEPGVYLPYVSYDLVPTPPPVTPTVTPPPPGGDFEQGFTSKIEPWLERRWTNGTSFALSHDPGEDAGRQGFLNLLVNTSGSHYVIASPLVAGKAPPYNIETVVKMRSPREDGDQYGIVFGGNYNGGQCPAPDFSTCFTQYYEMRVRYYHDDAANKDRMEMKLKRIDSHDANNNNEGPDLIEWTRVAGVEENDFIEWDITVSDSGKISISADKNPVASAEDSTYINNPYFGVIVRTEDHSDAEAKYDYIKVD